MAPAVCKCLKITSAQCRIATYTYTDCDGQIVNGSMGGSSVLTVCGSNPTNLVCCDVEIGESCINNECPCNCLSFGFTGIRCQAGYYDFYLSGYENGRPSYLGTIMSVECKVFWDGTQWGFQQTDPSFPEIVFFSTIDTFNICELIGSDWQIGDITNFPVICTFLSGLDVALIDCPQLDCDCIKVSFTYDGVDYEYQLIFSSFDEGSNVYIYDDNVTYLALYYNPILGDGSLIIFDFEADFRWTLISNVNEAPCPTDVTLTPLESNPGTITNLELTECSQPITTTTTTTIPVTTTTTTYVPVPNTPLEPTNECDVITIFPMGVECFTINPTNTETFDGIASLVITGGTPPYEILWETGSIGTTITNLKVGEYTATITDSYGDFVINTTCELTAPLAPTTTTTTSTTTLPSFGDLCMILSTQKDRFYSSKFIDFVFNGYYNGKPSWFSNVENVFMYWNTGTTNQWLVSGSTSNTLFNPNPTPPPTSGWAFLGPSKVLVNVVEGSCDNLPPLQLGLSKNDSTCENNGSIVATASGGAPPYLYSLNGGVTTQSSPIFQNLAGGTYSVSVIDSTSNTVTQNITLNQLSSNVTYVVTLNSTGSGLVNNFNITISPALPAGVTITYDIVYQTEFKVAPTAGSAVQTVTPTVNVNGSPISNPSPIVTNSTLFNPCNSGNFSITNRVYTWSNVNMTTSTTVNGTISIAINPTLPLPSCYSANFTRSLTLNNLQISGCDCCSVILQQTSSNEIISAL